MELPIPFYYDPAFSEIKVVCQRGVNPLLIDSLTIRDGRVDLSVQMLGLGRD